jgi:hypothetical protein
MKALPKVLIALTAAAALSLAHPASANLVTNGGFETGDFTGWTVNGVIGSNINVVGTVGGVSPHSGNFQAIFSPGTGSVGISQTLTTTPSTIYTVDFWAATGPNVGGSLSVNWGGSTVFSHVFPGATGYTEFTFNETASSASTDLSFVYSNSGILFLDDISVNPAGVGVPDGGSTLPLLGCALLGLAALRRKLNC